MLIFLHQLSKEVRNCNRFLFFFSLKKYVLSQKRGLPKRGGFSAFPSKLFKKKWSQNHIFTHCRSSCQEVFCKKGALRNLAKFTGKHLWQSLSATLLKKRLWHRCFPVNFAKLLRTFFLIEQLRWLLLTLEFLKIVLSSMGSPKLQL